MGQHSSEKVEDHYDDEISLKELILKLKEFWQELWKNWWLIILFCIPFLAFNLYKHFTFEKDYTASLTFMVNEDEGGGGLAGMSGVLGSFGLGGAAGGEYNLEKMLSLLKSRKIIQEVLLYKVDINQNNDFFANHLIKYQEIQEDWKDLQSDIDLRDFLFSKNEIQGFGLRENTALKYLHSHLIGNNEKGIPPQLNSSITEETGILKIELTSRNELLSIELIEALFDKLSEYYVSKSIEKQLNTYNLVSLKADSLQGELRSAEYQLANFMDKNRGLYNRKDQLEQFRLEAKVKMLSAAYAKVIEQKEIAEFSLNDQTPVVQIIDHPIAPLEPSKSSLLKNVVIACLLGGFLASIFIIGRKVIRDALS